MDASAPMGAGIRPDFRSGWTKPMLRARARAGGLSLAVSATVVGTVATAIALLLHTLPFFWATGGIRLIGIVALVDVVLGPLLVFLVFDRRKKSLRRDLAVIVLLQLAAIAYGIHASVLARPVFMTFVVDRFELLTAAEVDPDELTQAPEAFRALPWRGPALAAAVAPTSKEERENLLFASTSYGIDLRHMLRHYVPYESKRADVVARARPLEELERYNEPAKLAAALAPLREKAADPDRLRWLPVQGPREDLVAVINADEAALVAVLRLQPWQ